MAISLPGQHAKLTLYAIQYRCLAKKPELYTLAGSDESFWQKSDRTRASVIGFGVARLSEE
jgi:hypothetical protein